MSAIQPKILTWARETAGLSLDEAARELGLNAARGKTGAERLAQLEQGEVPPSPTLLLKMAKRYHRPLVAFYLSDPPTVGDRGQDFRSLPAQEKERYSPDLDALVRDIKARQELIHSMLEDERAEPIDFVASAKVGAVAVSEMATRIAQRIGFKVADFRTAKNADEAFTHLRQKIESAGMYVLLIGNLGSYHTNIPVEVFRGFALADKIAPMIVINDQDARTAWSFTAVHELVHLWLGETGVSGSPTTTNTVEQYCNDVAGEFLLPAAELDELRPRLRGNISGMLVEIRAFAEARRVSRSMVAYKLLRTHIIEQATWVELDAALKQEWHLQRQQEKDKNREIEGGPSYYVVKRHRVGQAILKLVRRSLDDGTITYTKASRVLGVKPRNIEPLYAAGGAR